jgi:DNA polymerase III delta prime subunit
MMSYNDIFDRNNIKNNIIKDICNFENNKNNNNYKRGFYIYGNTGIGKTKFISEILKELNYDIILYNASDMRNKSIVDDISSNNMSDKNVVSMFSKNKKKIAIIMDEIDGMNNGDKGGISSLITLIRNKKTKRQQKELISPNPIFCISTNEVDKKISELMKVCNIYKFEEPTKMQIENLIKIKMPNVNSNSILEYIQNDLRKFNSLYNIYNKNSNILENPNLSKYILRKSVVENSKNIVFNLYQKNRNICDNNSIMNDTDRTIVGLLWHENITDCIENNNNKNKLTFYNKILENICYSDYIDRIIFQKQIWQLNELSCYIKIFYNNYLLHNTENLNILPIENVRFTKVLTKYSTEFNNYTFFQNLFYKLQIDKKDIIKLFHLCKNNIELEKLVVDIYELSELEINRIYRYIFNYSLS